MFCFSETIIPKKLLESNHYFKIIAIFIEVYKALDFHQSDAYIFETNPKQG